MSQLAISKHLRVLHDARLVMERREGRHRFYRLNPAPLRDLDCWLAGYREFWAVSLANLKKNTWKSENPKNEIWPTNARLVFETIARGARLRFRLTGFEGFAESQKGHSQGWSRVLGWLREKCQLQGA